MNIEFVHTLMLYQPGLMDNFLTTPRVLVLLS